MIYLYASRGSSGAREIVDQVKELGGNAKRWKKGAAIPFRKGDLLVNWGESYPHLVPGGVKVLNPRMVHGKLSELTKLNGKGIATVPYSVHASAPGWVGRRSNHQGGTDLLHPPHNPDYYVQKLEFKREFRVHVMRTVDAGLVSIRAGLKVHRAGFPNPHPWVRSYDGGWSLDYGDACQAVLKQRVRDAAKGAVEALGLDFGAVDIGTLSDGSPIVLEVNKAPGQEGNTTLTYAKHFMAHAKAM